MAKPVDRIRSLVEALYLGTDQGKIKWRESFNPAAYECTLANNLVSIEPDGGDIRISITRPDGATADSFTDMSLKEYSPHTSGFQGYFSLMSALLEMARRNATGADVIIDNIIEELGGPFIDSDGHSSQELDDDLPF